MWEILLHIYVTLIVFEIL